MKHFYIAILFCCFFLINTSYSQERSPLQNFKTHHYKAANQNWKIAQDNNKHIYVANNDGLLEFNGDTWSLYPSPNNTVMRAVAVIQEKIYTGCHMEFGVWEKNNFGTLTYTSISQQLKIPLVEDEEIWNILSYEDEIIFQSLNRLYIYDTLGKTFKIINSKTVLEKVFVINKTIYFQKSKDGLYKIENDITTLLSRNDILKENIIVNIYPKGENLLLITQEEGMYLMSENGVLRPWRRNIELFKEKSVYSSCRMKNGSIILGTIANGIYIVSQDGKVLQNINQRKGLNNNTVLATFEDKDHNLWLGLDNGISILNLNSPYTVYTDYDGKLGAVYATIRHNDILYIGTNQGLFYKYLNKKRFHLIENTQGQVWCLKLIENKLFCGHNKGTFEITKTKASLISEVPGTWDIKKIPNSKDKLLQGNYKGLYILQKEENGWRLKNKIKGFENSCRYFEINDKNQIFINHEYKGIYSVKTNEDFTEIIESTVDSSKKGIKSGMISIEKKIIYTGNAEIATYNEASLRFQKDSLWTDLLFKKDHYVSGKLVKTIDNKVWAFTDKNIVYIVQNKHNTNLEINKISLPYSFRKDIPGYENISLFDKNQYLIGNSEGYMIVNLNKEDIKEHTVYLNKITKEKINESEKYLDKSKSSTIDYKENNVSFSYGIPLYEKYSERKYQYKLEGLHNNWSDWSTNTNANFKNLSFGNYTFHVRAKVGNKPTQNSISYKFSIGRPWYLSNLWIAFYILLTAFIFAAIHTIYRQYYKRQKQEFLLKKEKEVERLQLENEKALMKLRNDKLKSDIEIKNKELAASTMSIIKKNEFLNNIKKELSLVENKDIVKPVIKIIDKNIDKNGDWELFQEAFNNADKDFLKKVKDRHPSLTPNDLKLCAYLRLNLSSKEIAPLLNISYKSVEIKRYRLRKKMGLSSKDNLTHHILEI
ncbi:MAG: triple tyrosine motif-containing protein [Flavicella sp.]